MFNVEQIKNNSINNIKITFLMSKHIQYSSYPIKFLILELIIDIMLSSIKEIKLLCLKINNIIKVIPFIMLIFNVHFIIFLLALNLNS
jgi:hypothetical protein